MAIKITTEDFNSIISAGGEKFISKLRALTLHPGSGLNDELDNLLKISKYRKAKCKLILAHDKKKLIGWAILSREAGASFYSFNPKDGTLFEVFVDPSYRGKGIGAKIIKTARQKAGRYKLAIVPWDWNSYGFYSTFKNLTFKQLGFYTRLT